MIGMGEDCGKENTASTQLQLIVARRKKRFRPARTRVLQEISQI